MYSAHTDWLNVTTPYDQSGGVREAVLDACGHSWVDERQAQPGTYDMYGRAGTMFIRRRGQVMVIGFSGGTIASMRTLGVWSDVLTALGDYPHKVTLIDAAYDVPVHAPPVLSDVYERFKTSGVKFTGRAVGVSKTGWKVGRFGDETGTIYVGTRKAEVRARVYDKQQQLYDTESLIVDSLLRYELTVTNKAAAVSLKDAWDPTALFWHFMGGRLLDRPVGVPEWVPGGIGFDLPKREPLSALEKLQRFLRDNSNWQRQIELMRACGDYGLSIVVHDAERKLGMEQSQ